jgi:hypothetical protein
MCGRADEGPGTRQSFPQDEQLADGLGQPRCGETLGERVAVLQQRISCDSREMRGSKSNHHAFSKSRATVDVTSGGH